MLVYLVLLLSFKRAVHTFAWQRGLHNDKYVLNWCSVRSFFWQTRLFQCLIDFEHPHLAMRVCCDVEFGRLWSSAVWQHWPHRSWPHPRPGCWGSFCTSSRGKALTHAWNSSLLRRRPSLTFYIHMNCVFCHFPEEIGLLNEFFHVHFCLNHPWHWLETDLLFGIRKTHLLTLRGANFQDCGVGPQLAKLC